MQSSLQHTLKVKQASHGTSPTCILSPSDRQRRTGLQAVARACTSVNEQNPCIAQASGVVLEASLAVHVCGRCQCAHALRVID